MAINSAQLRKQFKDDRTRSQNESGIILAICGIIALAWLLGAILGGCTLASERTMANIDVNRLVNAIYIAEGGPSTKHPYGILVKYKHTIPRQACINTIKSALKRYMDHHNIIDSDRFIKFLAISYCPIGAANDPSGLNRNWVKNVKYYYNKEA